jgi:hypothetical protein
VTAAGRAGWLRRAIAIVLMVVGAVLMLLGIDTPGAVAFMLAGMLIMYVSGRRATQPD